MAMCDILIRALIFLSTWRLQSRVPVFQGPLWDRHLADADPGTEGTWNSAPARHGDPQEIPFYIQLWGQLPWFCKVKLRVTGLRALYKIQRIYKISSPPGRSGDRIPVEERFFAPVQTGAEAHPTSYIVGTWSFPVLKRTGRGVLHQPLSSAVVKKE